MARDSLLSADDRERRHAGNQSILDILKLVEITREVTHKSKRPGLVIYCAWWQNISRFQYFFSNKIQKYF